MASTHVEMQAGGVRAVQALTRASLSGYRTHIFDCDGVLLDTARAKTQAFHDTALRYGGIYAARMERLHRSAGSTGRRARWERFFAECLERDPLPGEVDVLVEECTRRISDTVVHARHVPGVDTYLHSLRRRADRIVVSGIEGEELKAILAAKNLDWLFTRIYGGDKHAILPRLVESGEVALPAVYYGDVEDDYHAATAAGLDFVWVAGYSEWSDGAAFCAGRGIPVIQAFTELLGAR